MITEDLYSLAPQFDFRQDAATNSIYGVYKGFGMSIKAVEEKNCFVFSAWAKKGALSDITAQQWLDEYASRPENSYIKAKNVNGNLIAAVLLAEGDSAATCSRLHGFIFDITSFFMMNYFTNTCEKCGSAIGLDITTDADGIRTQLCRMCAEKVRDEVADASFNSLATPLVQPDVAVSAGSVPLINPQSNADVGLQPYEFAPKSDFPQTANTYQSNGVPAAGGTSTANAFSEVGAFGTVGTDSVIGTGGVNSANGSDKTGSSGTAEGVQSVTPFEYDSDESIMKAPDYMDSVDPNTAPQSTGYSTPEQVAALAPPIQSGMAADFSPAPLENDFRADPSYTSAPPIYSPITSVQIERSSSNPLLGFVGALLFSLIACVIWVLIGKLGYTSYRLGGLAMGFCTVTGYKLLGKRFDIFGMISCIIVILLAVLGSNIFLNVSALYEVEEAQAVVELLGYNGFWDVFFNYFSFMKTFEDTVYQLAVATGITSYMDFDLMGEFIKDLLFGYLYSGIGFCGVGIPAYRNSD